MTTPRIQQVLPSPEESLRLHRMAPVSGRTIARIQSAMAAMARPVLPGPPPSAMPAALAGSLLSGLRLRLVPLLAERLKRFGKP